MNQERPIEKLLRQYAQKRRADAGPPAELHPATRRLLQGEVARQFGRETVSGATPSLARLLKRWLPQLAWTLPLFLLVAFGLWSLTQRTTTKQLALGSTSVQRPAVKSGESLARDERKDRNPDGAPGLMAESASARSDAAIGPPPSAAAPPVRSSNHPVTGLADQNVGAQNYSVAQSLAFSPAPPASSLSRAAGAEPKEALARDGYEDRSKTDRLGRHYAGAPVRKSSAEFANTNRLSMSLPVPASENLALRQQVESRAKTGDYTARELANVPPLSDATGTPAPAPPARKVEGYQTQQYSQSFVSLDSGSLKLKAAVPNPPAAVSPVPVLANFRVEQMGRQLRVVDSDGSTYLGESDDFPVGEVSTGSGRKEQEVQLVRSDGKPSQLPAAKLSPQPGVQNYWFRVSGTNRTLNQTVVFTWSYVAMTNAPLIADSGKNWDPLDKDAKKLPNQFPGLWQHSVLNGRAQFGSGGEIEINAIPVFP